LPVAESPCANVSKGRTRHPGAPPTIIGCSDSQSRPCSTKRTPAKVYSTDAVVSILTQPKEPKESKVRHGTQETRGTQGTQGTRGTPRNSGTPRKLRDPRSPRIPKEPQGNTLTRLVASVLHTRPCIQPRLGWFRPCFTQEDNSVNIQGTFREHSVNIQ
jgi:hypothetical protein